MKTSWEKKSGARTEYIYVTRREVVTGENFGTGMTDNAGTCSHQEFLKGQFQDLILQSFGRNILEEVIYAVKKSSTYAPFLKQTEEIRQLKEYLDAIPVDNSLKTLYKDPKTINGFSFYGNLGSYKTLIKSETITLFFERARGYLEDQSKRQISIQLPGHASAVVELHDHFYVIVNQNCIVINPEGKIVFNSTDEKMKENTKESIFGSWLRLERVYRNKNVVFFGYWWFNHEYNDGLLKFELGKGFSGHCELPND